MRGVHRSLKRNWILDAYALSNSNLTFLRGERGRGFTPPFLLVFASSISSLPSRSTPSSRLDYTRFQFHPSSIIPIAFPPITPFNSTLLNSNSSLPFPFFDRISLSIPFPFPPSITIPLPRFQSLFDYTPSTSLITTLPDYAPFDYTLSTYLSIPRSIVSIAMVAAVTNRKCKTAWSYEGGRGRIYGPSGIRDTCSQPRINI